MRLIDADDCKDLMYVMCMGQDKEFIRAMEQVIDDCPTVDAVPIVRCKDCKYWDYGDCYRLELSRPDDFCSYGERKTDA